jgi:hypothetical protein
MWTAGDEFRTFETSTWQKPLPPFGTELGSVFTTSGLRWLTDFEDSDDARLRSAVEHGIHSALLVPIREAGMTIGALELLSGAIVAPDADVAAGLEAVAIQLGHFSHLLRQSAEPRWRLGRI